MKLHFRNAFVHIYFYIDFNKANWLWFAYFTYLFNNKTKLKYKHDNYVCIYTLPLYDSFFFDLYGNSAVHAHNSSYYVLTNW